MPDPRTSPTDPAPTDPVPTDRPRRVSRTLLTAMIAGGLVVGGTGIAYAAASATASSPSPSADAPPAGPGPGAGQTDPGKHGHRGPHGGPRGDRANDIDGRITAVDTSSVTVSDEFGQARTYTLGSTTRVHSGPGQQLTAADLTVGEHVHVRGQNAATSGGNVAAVDVDVRQAHIDGVVTAVDGTSVTVTDRDGFTRHITTSTGTTYQTAGPKGGGQNTGQNSTADSVHSGSVIRAEGKVDGDGTTLDATTIVIRTAPSPTGATAPVSPNTQPAPGPAGQSPAPQPGQPTG